MAKVKHASELTDLPKPYHSTVMSQIAQETNRGVAIVGAAYVDLVLREAITMRMVNASVAKEIFENRGPLQGFGAKIQIAYSLGVYGDRAYKDLKLIKDIRNAFAHSAEAVEFENKIVESLCNELWFAKKINYGKRSPPVTAREQFIREVELITDGLHENVGRQKQSISLSTFLMMGPNT